MKITIKVIPHSETNQWVGWFGEDVIKVKLQSTSSDLGPDLEHFITTDLGIRPKDMVFIGKKDKNMFTYVFPDVAWELFLTIIDK